MKQSFLLKKQFFPYKKFRKSPKQLQHIIVDFFLILDNLKNQTYP